MNAEPVLWQALVTGCWAPRVLELAGRGFLVNGYENLPPMKRQVKDSVFTDLFGIPEYLLELYRSLHPEDEAVAVQDLETVTLQNVLVDAPYNDLGFTVRGRLIVLVEAQSTWSPNIALRALLYLAKTLDRWFCEHACNLYSSTKVDFPRPELYVIYTGGSPAAPREISIADDFFPGQRCSVDVRVEVLRGGSGILGEYVEFTKIADEQVREFGRTREAVCRTIELCVSRGVLAGYLASREREVHDIMITLYDEQEVQRRYYADLIAKERAQAVAEGREEGREEGRAEGRAEGEAVGQKKGYLQAVAENTRRLMASLGFTVDQAMDVLGIAGEERRACLQAMEK